MSVQLVAPHNVAINAMNKISVRSCNALSARGSGKSEKHSANRCIGCSLLIRSYFQNPFLQIWQPLAESDMRFPCPPGEGKKSRQSSPAISADACAGGTGIGNFSNCFGKF